MAAGTTERPLTIGQVARSAGVGVETVRFYERQGLLAEPPRRRSGYRQYTGEVVGRLRFIRRAKALGFSLSEIGELLALRGDTGSTAGDVKQRAEAKVAEIEERIRDLRRVKKALTSLAQHCPGHGTLDACPIIESLDRSGG